MQAVFTEPVADNLDMEQTGQVYPDLSDPGDGCRPAKQTIARMASAASPFT
jgi:hypothetical protein